ncbi:ATP-binding protein [Bacteroidales bacterium OttesenSCG-928-B11]|nr:ATP-binding protein [Bacteroidales bacterium OttesenSCG-928-E04]MDL2308781.1 ATP-binding protein [Bacteroidales bacterium OttesenSCG-928-C03]MDL2311981.1 ATP-binding protein [Bacteroidales bacterium OttesenSCG-928-B11]
MERAILEQNPHWKGKIYQHLHGRSFFESIKNNLQVRHVQVLTGIRRSGKSSGFRMLVNELMKSEDPKSILMLNMDDPLYYEIWENPSLFYNIIELAEKLTGEKIQYLFIDEAQAVKGWETFVKSAYDSELFRKIFVTGSNSSFLNNEHSILLSGRYLEEKVFPYSFSEILSQNKIDTYFDAVSESPKVLRLLDDCLEWGCFPEISPLKNTEIKSNLLKSYFDSIIMKDCISRYQIGDVATFKKLLLYSISNAGAVCSYKSLGTATGTNENTAKKYINILNDSHIIQDVSNFAFSLKENVRNSHKIYVADNGITNAVSYRFWDNKAKLFENFVFNELQKQKYEEITFANSHGECDFVIKNKFDYHGIQVCYELTPENQAREVGGFAAVEKETSLTKKTIITYNQSSKIDDVEIIPIWKWIFNTN